MRFTSIASGSSGNVSYIGTENTHILVDCGITMKAINQGLHSLELELSDIQGIFLTHEHIDHIRAVGTITRRYGTPIYGTVGTLQELLLSKAAGPVDPGLLRPVVQDEAVQLGDLRVTPFSIYHDAADPVGYRVESGGRKAAVATDMGHYDEYIREYLSDLDAMVLEANHDVAMLSAGGYPKALKRRILSDRGHLSNENAGKLLDTVLNEHLQHIFLGHLSQENNLPELAMKTVCQEIDASDSLYQAKDFHISVAKREEISPVVEW